MAKELLGSMRDMLAALIELGEGLDEILSGSRSAAHVAIQRFTSGAEEPYMHLLVDGACPAHVSALVRDVMTEVLVTIEGDKRIDRLAFRIWDGALTLSEQLVALDASLEAAEPAVRHHPDWPEWLRNPLARREIPGSDIGFVDTVPLRPGDFTEAGPAQNSWIKDR